MKRLITHKQHDIQDSKLVAEYNNDLEANNTDSCIEELYLKKSGEYFLYGRGGTTTQWSDYNHESCEGIRLLTTDEAKKWIDLHAHDRYEYADLFGEAEE